MPHRATSRAPSCLLPCCGASVSVFSFSLLLSARPRLVLPLQPAQLDMQGSSDASSASDDLSPSQPTLDSAPSANRNLKIAIPRLAPPSVKANQQRTPRACVACRARKTKCDGRKPVCRQCRRLDLVCNYAGSKRERQQLELESVRNKVVAYESLLSDIITDTQQTGASSIEDILNVRSAYDVATSPLQSTQSIAILTGCHLPAETLSSISRCLCGAASCQIHIGSSTITAAKTGDFFKPHAYYIGH